MGTGIVGFVALTLAGGALVGYPRALADDEPGSQGARGAEVTADAAPAPRRALLLGSSSVAGAVGRSLDAGLSSHGIPLDIRARRSSGLARADFFDWTREIRWGAPLSDRVGVIVLVGGNDTQPVRRFRGRRRVGIARWEDEPRWRRLYGAVVTEFLDQLCARQAGRVAWLLPPNAGRPIWTERIRRVRAVQRDRVEAHQCDGTEFVLIDGDDPEAPFVDGESRDGVHLNDRGAARLFAQIEDQLLGALGRAPEPRAPEDAPAPAHETSAGPGRPSVVSSAP